MGSQPAMVGRPATGVRERASTRRNVAPSPRGFTGLPKTGQDAGAGTHPGDRCPLPPNPADSTALTPRQTDTRNGVTPSALSVPSVEGRSVTEQAPAARAEAGRIAQEANARGKAPGYADVGTMVWTVEARVGVHTS